MIVSPFLNSCVSAHSRYEHFLPLSFVVKISSLILNKTTPFPNAFHCGDKLLKYSNYCIKEQLSLPSKLAVCLLELYLFQAWSFG